MFRTNEFDQFIVQNHLSKALELLGSHFFTLESKHILLNQIITSIASQKLSSNDTLLEFFRKYIQKLTPMELVSIRNFIFQNKNLIIQNAELLLVWGLLEKKLGVHQTAMECFQKSLVIKENYIEAMREMTFLLLEMGKMKEAMNNFTIMSQIFPHDWKIWNDGGCTLKSIGKTDESLSWMKRAAEVCPNNAVLHANIALLEYEKHNYDQVKVHLDIALSLDASCAEALHTKAMYLGAIGHHEESYEYDLKALKIKPNYPQARLGLALSALILGNWEEGFTGYEHRWVGSDRAQQNRMPTINRPQWLGQQVYASSSISVLSEQGFGDCIQFARFIPELLEYFEHVYWQVPNELFSLVKFNFESEHITIVNDPSQLPLSMIDYEIPILSLGLALALTPEYIKGNSYLKVPQDNPFNNKLPDDSTLKVGIVYSGKPTLAKQELRSINPELLKVLDDENITFINLQKDSKLKVNTFSNYVDFMPSCNDFFDTAQLISQLDLVIAVDTSVAHLSAAMGVKTLMLNRLGSEWRWMNSKENTPWYVSMKIFNQKEFKNWIPVLQEVCHELSLIQGK